MQFVCEPFSPAQESGVGPSLEADKFVVRFPDEMRERIALVAREQHRSMNSEIVIRLDQSLSQDGVLGEAIMQLDDAELSVPERALLKQFRELSPRQQNALISLIEQDSKPAQ